MACEMLATQYGKVVDLSAGGLRIHGSGRCELSKGDVVPVKLKCAHGEISLIGRVAWTRKSLIGGYEAGIELKDVKPQTAALIKQLAQFGFIPHAEQTARTDEKRSTQQSTFEDPYVVLGIDASHSDAEVQATFRKLALECHPDRNRSPQAAAQFERLTRAYQAIRKRRCGFSRLAPAA